jgi:hypothetical protein
VGFSEVKENTVCETSLKATKRKEEWRMMKRTLQFSSLVYPVWK